MKEIRLFQNSEFGELEVREIDGKLYFPATDCARKLGYENPHKAIREHCRSIRKLLTPTNGGNQIKNHISEVDLFRLIARSKLKSAEKFERWIFDEIDNGNRIKPVRLRKGNIIIESLKELKIHGTDAKNDERDEHEVNEKSSNSHRVERQKKRWNSEKAEKIAWILMAIATVLNTISIIMRAVKM